MASDDKKLEVLHDHYKETCERMQAYLKDREQLFIALIVFCTIMLFQVYAPDDSSKLFGDFLAKHIGLPIDLSFVGSVVWFMLLGTLIKYCQRVVLIERQYDYLHDLEHRISVTHFEGKTYNREGAAYLKNYPKFSNWAAFLYTAFFPFVLLIVVLMKIGSEIIRAAVPPLLLFNIVILIAILYSLAIYLPSIHRRKFPNKKEKLEGTDCSSFNEDV